MAKLVQSVGHSRGAWPDSRATRMGWRAGVCQSLAKNASADGVKTGVWAELRCKCTVGMPEQRARGGVTPTRKQDVVLDSVDEATNAGVVVRSYLFDWPLLGWNIVPELVRPNFVIQPSHGPKSTKSGRRRPISARWRAHLPRIRPTFHKTGVEITFGGQLVDTHTSSTSDTGLGLEQWALP